jgi:plastocyanin
MSDHTGHYSNNNNGSFRHNYKSRKGKIYLSMIFTAVIISLFTLSSSIAQLAISANNQTLTFANISKMTTTQANSTTNANAASTYPPQQANSSKVFPETNNVAIVVGAALKRDKAYQPNPVNVKAGGTVTWTNLDTVVHTVTSGNSFNDTNFGRDFDSGFLGKGFSHIFFKAGEYPYFCQIHPTMVGKVVVK